MTTENDFIRKLSETFPVRPPVEIGIGDDGAVLCHSASERIVVVTDLLLDGVHFDLTRTAPRMAGRKAVAVNLSDLAAMGCRPTAAFVSIAVPESMQRSSNEFLTELYRGIEELTDRYNFTLAGGDTNSWDGRFAINVCLTGVPVGDRPILRSGAKPGDTLFVTGPLGGSLHQDRHLLFSPRLDTVAKLIHCVRIHAMIDISDGLSMDLHRLADASGCSAVLIADRIPIHSDVSSSLSADQRLHAALSDGEDFELLFCVDPESAVKLQSEARNSGMELYDIGYIKPGSGCRIRSQDGGESPLPVSGWQHRLP